MYIIMHTLLRNYCMLWRMPCMKIRDEGERVNVRFPIPFPRYIIHGYALLHAVFDRKWCLGEKTFVVMALSPLVAQMTDQTSSFMPRTRRTPCHVFVSKCTRSHNLSTCYVISATCTTTYCILLGQLAVCVATRPSLLQWLEGVARKTRAGLPRVLCCCLACNCLVSVCLAVSASLQFDLRGTLAVHHW